MALPPCFVPDQSTGTFLLRVNAGYDVPVFGATQKIHEAGLIRPTEGPTSRSGWELTEDGREALLRYVAAEMS